MSSFRVLQIDHVELFVPDRLAAAAWYQRVLGLAILDEFRDWAGNRGGPLMISSDAGGTKLALFEGSPQGARPTAGFHRVAFRATGEAFIEFIGGIADLGLKDQHDRTVTAESVVDHGKAYSLYFLDPYGHHLEVTTYDHATVHAMLHAGGHPVERR